VAEALNNNGRSILPKAKKQKRGQAIKRFTGCSTCEDHLPVKDK